MKSNKLIFLLLGLIGIMTGIILYNAFLIENNNFLNKTNVIYLVIIFGFALMIFGIKSKPIK